MPLEFIDPKETVISKVKQGGKVIGEIRFISSSSCYRYFPKGQKVGGEGFESLQDCKQSLEIPPAPANPISICP